MVDEVLDLSKDRCTRGFRWGSPDLTQWVVGRECSIANSLSFFSLLVIALELKVRQKEHLWETWDSPTYQYSLLAREAAFEAG